MPEHDISSLMAIDCQEQCSLCKKKLVQPMLLQFRRGWNKSFSTKLLTSCRYLPPPANNARHTLCHQPTLTRSHYFSDPSESLFFLCRRILQQIPNGQYYILSHLYFCTLARVHAENLHVYKLHFRTSISFSARYSQFIHFTINYYIQLPWSVDTNVCEILYQSGKKLHNNAK